MPKNLLKKLDSKSLKICNPHQGLLGKNGSQRRGGVCDRNAQYIPLNEKERGKKQVQCLNWYI